MSTTAPHIERLRANHHKALEALATNGKTGLQLWRRLRRLEAEANAAATAQCNGEAYQGQPYRNEEQWEAFVHCITYSVERTLGTLPDGFFVNGDPRGYALKIESDNLPIGLHRDWGNYGILAPEIND